MGRVLQAQLRPAMGLRTVVVVAAAALLVAVSAQGIQRPKVYKLHVLSEINNRYAKTLITSKIGNAASQAQEISFDAVLPEKAFISRFVMEMDGVVYEAYVRGKGEARQQYDAAVAEGRGAAHVAISVRDSNVVHVSVNVEPEKKVTFNLTYEELLQREMGAYSLRITINPRQPVQDLAVKVRIEEQVPLSLVEVPTLQQRNEVPDTPNNDTEPLARIERPTPSSAIVQWAPTKEQQRQRDADGISGQLVVRYDIDRDASPSQILVSEDGYFVHFYAPPGLPPLPKHVVFVLDSSSSMQGRKMEQLKAAMNTILDELNEGDVFSLVPFSSGAQVDKESLTMVKFPRLFSGGELVVAGRLASGSTEPQCAVMSGDGNETDAVPQPSVINVTSAERLWAYLTVRQLLDQDAAMPNETVRTRAKDIALRYSFVTSVTSLVVVKPNTTSAVNLNDPDAPRRASAPRLSSHRPIPRPPPPMHHATSASPRSRLQLSSQHSSLRLDADDTEHEDSPEDLPSLDNITWLEPLRNGSQVTLTINGTDQNLELALNETDGDFQNCTTPTGEPGVCRHLANCVLRDFTEKLDVFLSDWLCVVESSFLGVCCPDTTATVATNISESASSSGEHDERPRR